MSLSLLLQGMTAGELRGQWIRRLMVVVLVVEGTGGTQGTELVRQERVFGHHLGGHVEGERGQVRGSGRGSSSS